MAKGLALALAGAIGNPWTIPFALMALFLLCAVAVVLTVSCASCACGPCCMPYRMAEEKVGLRQSFFRRLLRPPAFLGVSVPLWLYSGVAGVPMALVIWLWTNANSISDYGSIITNVASKGADAYSAAQWIQLISLLAWALLTVLELIPVIWLMAQHGAIQRMFERHNYQHPATPEATPPGSTTASPQGSARGDAPPSSAPPSPVLAAATAAADEGSGTTTAAAENGAATAVPTQTPAPVVPPLALALSAATIANNNKKPRRLHLPRPRDERKRFLHIALDHKAVSFFCITSFLKALLITAFFAFGSFYIAVLQEQGFAPDTLLVWGLMITLFVWSLFASLLWLFVLVFVSREDDDEEENGEEFGEEVYLTERTERSERTGTEEGRSLHIAAAATHAPPPRLGSLRTITITPRASARGSMVLRGASMSEVQFQVEMARTEERNYLPPPPPPYPFRQHQQQPFSPPHRQSYSPQYQHLHHHPHPSVPMLHLPAVAGAASYAPYQPVRSTPVQGFADVDAAIFAGPSLVSSPASAPPSTPTVVPLLSSSGNGGNTGGSFSPLSGQHSAFDSNASNAFALSMAAREQRRAAGPPVIAEEEGKEGNDRDRDRDRAHEGPGPSADPHQYHPSSDVVAVYDGSSVASTSSPSGPPALRRQSTADAVADEEGPAVAASSEPSNGDGSGGSHDDDAVTMLMGRLGIDHDNDPRPMLPAADRGKGVGAGAGGGSPVSPRGDKGHKKVIRGGSGIHRSAGSISSGGAATLGRSNSKSPPNNRR